jgi:hypothetical protein
VGDHETYALQTVQRTYVGPPDIHYFLKYSVVNTWMYKVTFGQLDKNHWTYARVGWTSATF